MEGLSLPFPNARAQQTFFDLMLAGYAADAIPERVVRFKGDLGTKCNTWGDPKDWFAIDEWRSTQCGNGSNGTTSIYYRTHPIWEMQYGGFYPERVIPFLKKALSANYIHQIWIGGRGPKVYFDSVYRYRNRPTDMSLFEEFKGKETIHEQVDGQWTEIGHHYYRGGFLISNNLTRS